MSLEPLQYLPTRLLTAPSVTIAAVIRIAVIYAVQYQSDLRMQTVKGQLVISGSSALGLVTSTNSRPGPSSKSGHLQQLHGDRVQNIEPARRTPESNPLSPTSFIPLRLHADNSAGPSILRSPVATPSFRRFFLPIPRQNGTQGRQVLGDPADLQ